MMRVTPVKTKTFSPGDIRLNQTAEFIIGMCNGDKNIFDIANSYRETFNITLSDSINDCIMTLKYFKAVDIIKFK